MGRPECNRDVGRGLAGAAWLGLKGLYGYGRPGMDREERIDWLGWQAPVLRGLARQDRKGKVGPGSLQTRTNYVSHVSCGFVDGIAVVTKKTGDALSNKPDFAGLPNHYTDAQIAAYWNVDVRYVKALITSGALESFQVGKRRKVTEDQLRRYMDKTRGNQTCQTAVQSQQSGGENRPPESGPIGGPTESAKAKADEDASFASETETRTDRSASGRTKRGRPFLSAKRVSLLPKK